MPHDTGLSAALSVYFATDPLLAARSGRTDFEGVEAAIAGGVTCVQLRAKHLTATDQWDLGRRIRSLTRSAGVLFIVNDRVDLALALEADGVHLGEEDIPIQAARRLADAVAGPDFVIGFSTAVLSWAEQAVRDGADYVSVGNLFGTSTKPDAGSPIGTAPLTQIARSVDVPVIGIGGITGENAAEVIAAGGIGVVVISHFIQSSDPARAVGSLVRNVTAAKTRSGRFRTRANR